MTLNLSIPPELRDIHDAIPAWARVTLVLDGFDNGAVVVIRLEQRQIFALANADMSGEPAFNDFVRAALADVKTNARVRKSVKKFFVRELEKLLFAINQ
jgi:hypothetical protein